MELDRADGSACRVDHRRYSLRNALVQAGHRLARSLLDTLLADVQTDADFALAHSYGGYTTNLPLEDLLDGKAWVAYAYDGEPLAPEHGGPARLLVPHLYFWKSAKWVRGIELMDQDSPASGSNWDITTTATHGASSGIRGLKVRRVWRAARLLERRTETASASTLILEVPGWPGHLAGQHVDVRLTDPTATRRLAVTHLPHLRTATESRSLCNG